MYIYIVNFVVEFIIYMQWHLRIPHKNITITGKAARSIFSTPNMRERKRN